MSAPSRSPAPPRDTAKPPDRSAGGAGRDAAVQLKAEASRAGSFAAQEAALSPVQRKGSDAGRGVHEAAAHGISGSGGALPFSSQIQQSFGAYDVSNVQAHTDDAARQGSEAIGAEAYATGTHIAFGGNPDLHTAAHEAAHVVQQSAGVQLSGGVGRAGDAYERHADQVADAVVAGQSAEPLLARMAGGAGAAVQRSATPPSGSAVQRVSAPAGRVVQRDDGGPGAPTPDHSMRTTPTITPTAQNNQDTNAASLANPDTHPMKDVIKGRVKVAIAKLAALGGTVPDGEAAADEVWTKIAEALLKTDAQVEAAPKVTVPDARREANQDTVQNLHSAEIQTAADAFLQPLQETLATWAGSQFGAAKTYAFYSNGCARALAEEYTDLTLETSAIGGIFDNVKLSGDYDMQLWGALSATYAQTVMAHFRSDKRIHVFIGPGANDYNTFAAFEAEALEVGAEKHRVDLSSVVKCHAVAAADANARTPDKNVKGLGDFDAVLQSGGLADRATLGALAATKHREKFYPTHGAGGAGASA